MDDLIVSGFDMTVKTWVCLRFGIKFLVFNSHFQLGKIS